MSNHFPLWHRRGILWAIMTPCCEIFPSTIQSNHRTFPALCAQVPQNSQPSFHTSTAPSASAMRSIPCHTMALHFVSASTHSSCSFIFAPGRLANPILLLQTCPATAHIYIYLHLYIYIHIIYIYTYIQSHISLFCRHALFCVPPAKLPLPFAPVTCPAKKVGRRHQGGSPTYNYGL